MRDLSLFYGLCPESAFIWLFVYRDNLSAVNRELVTVATLISLESVPNQLRSHLMILKNLGIDKPEQQRITQNIAQYSPSSAQKADDMLNAVF